jgi:DNA (cytosine-5)-methyltransferase 1
MSAPLRVLDLFSGIGGFTLGLERTGGFRTGAFCEIEPYPRKILERHWPDVPIFPDVRALTGELLAANGIAVDVICGGFPCQDISVAGNGAGLDGERSGLWSEITRLVGEIRPRILIVENVSALLTRGLERVLGDLAALGFDAEWHCIPACAVGAPHRRDRIWIVAYPVSGQLWQQSIGVGWSGHTSLAGYDGAAQSLADAAQERCPQIGRYLARHLSAHGESAPQYWPGDASQTLADAESCGRQQGGEDAGRRDAGAGETREWRGSDNGRETLADAYLEPPVGFAIAREKRNPWAIEPDVGRVAHGVPARVDRLKALGNAVVPQIPEMIGRAILEAIEATGPIMQDYRT